MDWRVNVSKEQLEQWGNVDLCAEMIKAPIQLSRGQNLQKKKEVYDELTPGQQALYSFWVLYGHVRSGWMQFCLGSYAQYLGMIKHGLQFVGAQGLLANLIEAENLYQPNAELLNSLPDQLSKPPDSIRETLFILDAVKQQFAQLDQNLPALLEETLKVYADYIRTHSEDFIV